MNFFQQLAQLGKVDVTLRIMQKNDKLTIMAMPGISSAAIPPFNITGTPEELDAEFFSVIAPGIEQVAGLISNLNEVKEQLVEKKEKPKPEKVETKKVVAKIEKPKTEEPALFS